MVLSATLPGGLGGGVEGLFDFFGVVDGVHAAGAAEDFAVGDGLRAEGDFAGEGGGGGHQPGSAVRDVFDEAFFG